MDSGPENSTLQDNVVAAANVVLRDNPQQTRPECVDTSCRNREGGDCAKCGEPGQLNICLLEELNAQFEDRLRFIEQNGNDDKFKVEIYERWIHQLRLVNLDLLTTIKEMEKTCRDRVVIMKENYKKNLARYGSEAQARAKRDRDSLLEVIRRAYTTGSWNIEGIRFYDVDIEEIFGKKGDITVDSQHENRMDGPTISLNLAVSSNCQYENSEIDELRQTLDARNKQIEHLELLLDMKYPEKNFSFERENADDLESQHFNTEYSTSNKILLHQLRQMNCEKSKELDEQSMQIEKMHKQIRALESKLEEGESSVQLDSDMSASLADLKLDESDASNRKLLQQLQNLIRFKSGQLEASLKDNEVLREQIEYFKSQLDSQSNVDKQSLVNEIKDHYDRNRQLEKKLREYEQSLLESNAAVDHRNNVINQLRQDISSLKKSTFINIRELGTSTDTASVTSFGSAKSGSSVDTVIMRAISPTRDVRELETEQVLNFSKEFTVMSEQVRQLEATKQAQDDIIADQWNKLNSTESEYRILRDEYENSEKKLHLIRSEIAKLIKTIRESFQGHFPLPQTIPPIEELVSRSFVQVDVADLSSEMFENDKQILGVLQSHLNSVTRNSLLVIADQRELRKHIAALQQVNRTNGELLENLKNDRLAAERETESKETSIDSDIMTESSTETLAAQRLQVQNVLQGMAKEIAYLIGKDLSNDSLTSFAELDATPLHCLIDDLKQEIDAKDSLLQSKSDIIAQLEQRLCTREKELHRLKLRQESVEQDRLSYEKRIGNLQRALQDHDETIEKLKQQNRSLKQQLEDMKETLQTYKENIRQAIEEKASVEDELEEQKQRHLVQIRNEMSNMQAQIANFQKEIACRQRDQDYLRFFRQKCAETTFNYHIQEMEHQQELHRMRDEIESLSIQLASCEDTNIQHEQLLSQSNALQNTISELENHNEILRKAIQSYEGNNEQLQQELSTFQFQYDNLNQELENLKSACSEKDNKIISLNAEREKLLGDLNFHRRMCKCGFNTSAKERSKTPVSHSLQRQVVQKTLEATKAADALKQKTVELKKLENQYVEERVRLTEQTTDLFTQIGKLKGKNSNLEQSLFHKEELIERLQQSLRDITQRLTSKAEIAQSMETKNANLSQLLEKFREDSTVREKKLADELNNIRRSSQDQTNQLQQCENQIAWHRDELESLRGKFDSMLKERDALKQDIVELNCKLACSAGKESALCDVLKQLQDEVSDKTGRLTEVEENYRKIYQAYQHLKSFNEDLSKQNQVSRSHLENYKKLVEFKRQTIGTVELAQKFAEESRRRERAYLQKIAEQKQVIVHLRDDRIKLTEKLYDYHRDSLILNRKLEDYHQANIGRNMNTSFHQTFYPSEAYKLMRSSSDPNCKKNDELLHRVETTSNRILRTREFWHQGIKEILSPTRFAK
ncbi:interaptin-like isoform X4 [Topomyia yanbarensis]|uniref:interaptin-like isoform X4 n=1 Tax=Topomyia yanbarensis TaxID=2498891 RepID=UPI00273C7C18|nr:interaptin-like isoform X4 [Topomyia yanbarensis]